MGRSDRSACLVLPGFPVLTVLRDGIRAGGSRIQLPLPRRVPRRGGRAARRARGAGTPPAVHPRSGVRRAGRAGDRLALPCPGQRAARQQDQRSFPPAPGGRGHLRLSRGRPGGEGGASGQARTHRADGGRARVSRRLHRGGTARDRERHGSLQPLQRPHGARLPPPARRRHRRAARRSARGTIASARTIPTASSAPSRSPSTAWQRTSVGTPSWPHGCWIAPHPATTSAA